MSSLILNRPWSFRNPKEELINHLSKALSLPRSLTAFLVNRGLDTRDAIEEHLTPSLSRLNDPFSLKDMDKAVSRIVKAIKDRERVGIFGDFDADGVTATALLYLFFRELGLEVFFYIPHREKEGYGLNSQGIDYLASKGCSLLVTVDCGITSLEEVSYSNARGMDTIVTDHHTPMESLPEAVACIDPKRVDCSFPFKELSGVGVAFYLAWAVRGALYRRGFFEGSSPPNLKKYLDLVAIGTVADMMPLYRENRILVRTGLEVMSTEPRCGIRALLDSVGLDRQITCTDIAFRLGPRLNAAGRMHHATTALDLLITDDLAQATRLCQELNGYNQERQRLERRLLSEVMELIKGKDGQRAHVLYGQGWQKGILGLVASKAVEVAGCPVILLSRDGDMLVGSGRSPDEIDLFSALSSCSHLFERFGGHRSAAGVRLGMERLDEFRRRFAQAVEKQAGEQPEASPLSLDARVELEELASNNYVEFLEMLEPFGPGYQGPLFSSQNFHVKDARVVGQGHLKIAIVPEKQSNSVRAIELLAWGHGDKKDISWEHLELAFTPSVNCWNGRKNIQLILKDARKT